MYLFVVLSFGQFEHVQTGRQSHTNRATQLKVVYFKPHSHAIHADFIRNLETEKKLRQYSDLQWK